MTAIRPSAGVQPRDGSDAVFWTVLFGAGTLALLALRLAALHVNDTDLFFDEAQYWAWSREPSFGYYSKPPLIAWLIGVATAVCGDGEACVRAPSPILHAATSVVTFVLGARLYDVRVGALSGLAFATLPGVSLSSGIISTDVPLLLAWALALAALWSVFETKSWVPALLLGLALGAGLNAKYAMAWFAVCFAAYLVLTPERRAILKDARLYAASAMAAALILPNLWWNAEHGFATLSHTADNAKWDGVPFNPGKMLEFFGAQFGVFGPILFAALIVIVWRSTRTRLPEPDRFLLAFSAPLIAVVTVQALLSRAHANWAAPAYVSATILVTATLVRGLDWRWLRRSFALHAATVAVLIGGAAYAAGIASPFGGAGPYDRTLGWKALADATRAEIETARRAGRPFAAVVTDQRAVTAELLYYMRGEPTPVVAWRDGDPQDHFELTRAFAPRTGEPVLLVSLKDATPITRAFANVSSLGVRETAAGAGTKRMAAFFALAGYKGS